MNDSSQTILVVDDNKDDIFAIKRALQRAQIVNPLQILTDGQQTLDYFMGSARFADRKSFPLPFIVFLDLKLPFLSGFEILEWMRGRPELEQMVVIVLTSSPERKDCEKAYALGARSYLIKPPTPEMLSDVMLSLGSFWLSRRASTPVLVRE